METFSQVPKATSSWFLGRRLQTAGQKVSIEDSGSSYCRMARVQQRRLLISMSDSTQRRAKHLRYQRLQKKLELEIFANQNLF
jgi:hypothetical protein